MGSLNHFYNDEYWVKIRRNSNLFILSKSTITDGASNMWGQRGNTSQDTIQLFILLIGFICIPLMLIPKPVIEIKKLKAHRGGHKHNPLIEEDDAMGSQMELERELNPSHYSKDSGSSKNHGDDAHGEPNEIFVHQLI